MDFSKLKYISTDVPTTDELELLNESRVRISQVIPARWIILGILAAYGVVPYVLFQYYSIDLSSVTTLQCVFPVLAWCAMATYNAFFLYSYQWFAFALGASLAYGGLLQVEYYGIVPPVSMPFENLSLQQTLPYGVTKWAWVTMTNMSMAAIGVYLMKTIRHREEELKKLVIKDNLTALYNRAYFFYRLNSEIQRAKRYNRALSLLIMDMDNFKRFNDLYGHLVGDQLKLSMSMMRRE